MDFEDDAFVLSARAHGEAGAIVELLTAGHGRYVAHVAGGASRRMRPFLQPGARVIARYRARGCPSSWARPALEPVGEGPVGPVRRAPGAGGPFRRRQRRRRRPARTRASSRRLLRLRGPGRGPGRSRHLAGGLCALRGGAVAGTGLRPRPVELRRHGLDGRPGLRQPAHRPGGQPRRRASPTRIACCKLPPFLLAPRPASGRRHRRRPGPDRPFPGAVRLRPAEPAAAAGAGVADRSAAGRGRL